MNLGCVLRFMRGIPHLLAAFFLSLAIGPAMTHACSCGEQTNACEAYGQAGIVFVGKILSSNRPEDFMARTEYEIKVEKVFIGNLGATVIAESYPDACGFGFSVGEEYLIYGGFAGEGSPRVERFAATYCSRTKLLREASDDMKFLQKDIKKMGGARIYGWIKEDLSLNRDLPPEKRTPPIEGFGLKVIGPDRRYELTTNSNGQFSLAGLTSGKYFIELIPTTLFYTEGREREELYVNTNGCSAQNFYLSRN
jgi:hypothetical protein